MPQRNFDGREKEALSLISNLTDLGIWEHHTGNNKLVWDDNMFKIHGIQPEDFKHSFDDWRLSVYPEDLKGAEDAFLTSVDSDGVFIYTFRIIRASDQSVRYIKANARSISKDEEGNPIFLGLNQDVTEFYQIQEDREEVMETLRDSQETAKIGSWQYYPASNLAVLDPVTKQIYGVGQDEYIPTEKGITYYKEGYSRDTITASFQKLLMDHTPYDLELELITEQGKEIWIRTIGKVKLDQEGNIEKAYGVFQDITEAKLKELELSQANETLQSLTEKLTDQNRSLSDFAHISSHNLRAPVANLMMLNELYAGSEDHHFREEIFAMVRSSTNDLKNTLDHLLESLVIQSKSGLDMSDCDVKEACDKVLFNLSEIIRHTEAKLNLQLDLEHLHAQPVYLDSILLNLIGNAIKYKHPERKPQIEVKAFVKDQVPYISISDNGIGIDLTRHGDKVFGLHKTFHKNSDAKGVGLFMVKAQMEAMGGTIRVESEVNKGSTFILKFKSMLSGY